jgi:hypothetical protein
MYSKLLLSEEFYSKFKNYEFILLYQLDCLVFSNNLEKWINLGYDFIGAPFLNNRMNPKKGFSRVGNGGLSIRNVNSFLKVLQSKQVPGWSTFITTKLTDRSKLDFLKKYRVFREVQNGVNWYTKNYSLNEDLFWSDRAKLFYPQFKIAPVNIALQFAFEAHPRYCYEKNDYQLPFGAHAWERWDRKFWETYLSD